MGEFNTLFWVHAHDGLKKIAIIGLESNFLGIKDDLIELAGFSKASDNLVGGISAEIDGKGQSEIVLFNNITELFAAFKLRKWRRKMGIVRKISTKLCLKREPIPYLL